MLLTQIYWYDLFDVLIYMTSEEFNLYDIFINKDIKKDIPKLQEQQQQQQQIGSLGPGREWKRGRYGTQL